MCLVEMKHAASLVAVALVLAGCGGGWEGGKTPGIQTVLQIKVWPHGRTEARFGNGGSTAISQVEHIQRPRRRASDSSLWPVPCASGDAVCTAITAARPSPR